MKLYYFEGKDGVHNFGDELNPFLWSRLLPDLDRRGPRDWLFVGIGTLLNERLPAAERTVVFGSGVGYGTSVPRPDETWRVYFVRGPLSATALGLAPSASLTDPAILLASLYPARPPVKTRFAFMPHWNHASVWLETVCRDAGIAYIDPRRPVEHVLNAIGEAGTLLAEAMHGAIVADTLRVPWIPIRSAARVLAFKWQDWCESVGVAYQPETTTSLWVPAEDRALAGARAWAKQALLKRQLIQIARSTRPTLSSDHRWEELLTAVRGKLAELKADIEVASP